MATLPKATTNVSDTAGVQASGTDLVCIISPVGASADNKPRLFGSADAISTQHGYCEGLEYAAYHMAKTGLGVMLVGIAIASAGVVSRTDSTGNTGSCVVSVTAGVNGTMTNHDGKVTVIRGGTIGTDQIVLGVSCDGGRTTKQVRLGTGNAYVIPFVGASLAFAAGTLVTGDTVLTWHGSSPRGDATGWAAARTALAAQQQGFRSVILMGPLANLTEAQAFLDQIEDYKSQNERFIYARATIPDRLPQAALSHLVVRMTGAPTLTFLEVGATGDTITRSAGSWITDGFAVGDIVTVAGSASNNVTGPIASLSATVLTFGTTDLANEGPVSACTVSGTPGLTFAEVGATGDTVTRSRGSWVDDGFRAGDIVTFAGTASNNVTTDGLTTVTALVLTLNTTDLAAEVIGSASVTATAGQTKAAWSAANDAAFASVNSADGRLDLDNGGRGRFTSPYSGWDFRRPISWGASAREFQHDLHVTNWRKSDGPIGFDLFDTDGTTLVEYDDRIDGAAASAARFTSARTYGNGPAGAYISQSLTRGPDGSLLSFTHNVAVVNLACTVVQLNTENLIGRSLTLNADGTATTDSLRVIAGEINAALELALLQNAKGEGPRASRAVWTPSASDVLNVPDAQMTGVLDLNLNGTIHSVLTSVRVRSGGQ